MSYATPEQFIRAFSEREARTLTDEDMTGFIDEEKLASALARASAQIDGYLVGRYRTRGLTARGFGGLLLRYRPLSPGDRLPYLLRRNSDALPGRHPLSGESRGRTNQPRAGYVRQRDPVIVTGAYPLRLPSVRA